MSQQTYKKKDRKSNRTWQKNERGDSKVKSNDSPEISDRRETSDILSLPSKKGGGRIRLTIKRRTFRTRGRRCKYGVLLLHI